MKKLLFTFLFTLVISGGASTERNLENVFLSGISKKEMCKLTRNKKALTGTVLPGAYLEGKYHQGYKRQMDIYVHILRNMDFKVSDTTYFMVCNGEKTNDFFENRIDFKTVLVPYKSDPSWIPDKIIDMKKTLDSIDVPEYNVNCESCAYLYCSKKIV